MLYLFSKVTELKLESILCGLSELDDEDFNGNNGVEYTSQVALGSGFTCDKDYVLSVLEEKYKDKEVDEKLLHGVVLDYSNYVFENFNYYLDFEIRTQITNNVAVISVAYITE